MAEKDESPTRGMIRRRVSFPEADESTLGWWELQDDPGLSIRLLIRDEIERNGYTDYANRPVAQKPRPGRPPKTSVPASVPGTVSELADDAGADADDTDSDSDDLFENEPPVTPEADDEVTGLHEQIANRAEAPVSKKAQQKKQKQTEQNTSSTNDDLLNLMSNRD